MSYTLAMRRGVFIALAIGTFCPVYGQDLATFEKSVTEHRLENGMRFLIVERREVPVVSFHLYADVGSVDEELGITGMAHMFEHMAFKGTTTIGTRDYEREKAALDAVDQAHARLREARLSGASPEQIEKLERGFEQAQADAAEYSASDELTQAIERAGGTGLNASTSNDATRYFVSLPSNKAELWFSLESARFLDPVLREFYKERDVVIEERRMRVESQPIGKLLEDFLSVAYLAHPYGRQAIGWRSDLESLTRRQAERFFQEHYTPSDLIAVVVGDVDSAVAVGWAETYFGRIPDRRAADPIWTVEPPQQGERRTTVYAESQPVLLIGYHKPALLHPDDAVFDAVQDVLSGGRTSRLYRSLVQDKRISAGAGGFPGFPGNKYPNLFLFFSFPAPGHTNEENEEAMLAEIELLKQELVSEEELSRVKARARANLIDDLDGNSGLAGQLAAYEVLTGDWRNLFKSIEAIERVSREDIQRVAREYFTSRNRTVGYLLPDEEVR
ncbi:MAG TPA: pitrilysin family protein [Vicinamibacteria bacterium]|nr:pitrilysin family protein [Vicinamibacteria bacterium]